MIAVLTYPEKKPATHACMLCNLLLKKSCFFQLFLISTLVFDVMPSISRFFCARLTGCVRFLNPGLPANEISCVSDAQTGTQCGITWGFKGACELHENLSPTLFAVKAHSLHYPTA